MAVQFNKQMTHLSIQQSLARYGCATDSHIHTQRYKHTSVCNINCAVTLVTIRT